MLWAKEMIENSGGSLEKIEEHLKYTKCDECDKKYLTNKETLNKYMYRCYHCHKIYCLDHQNDDGALCSTCS